MMFIFSIKKAGDMLRKILLVTLITGNALYADTPPAPAEKPQAPAEPAKVDSIGVLKLYKDINRKTAEAFIKKAADFAENDKIKGVLLVIDSGGGAAGASELMFREVKELAAQKPVVTLVVSHCGSGAYKTAVGSNWIVAPASASIGHIGAVYTLEKHKNVRINRKGYHAEVEYDYVYAGKDKVIGWANGRPMTPEERAKYQKLSQESYEIFCAAIAQQRKLSLCNVHEWADGQKFLGRTALEKKLIDQVGGRSEAVKALRKFIEEKEGKPLGKLPFVE